MKFIVSSQQLLKSLQTISGVLNTNNTLPILDNFLFELEDDKLRVTASDLETTMNVSLTPEKTEENGSIAIPARILLDTLKTFSDIPISFNINRENSSIVITTDEGNFKLAGQKGEEFPKVPELEGTTTLTMNAETIATAIQKSIFATGNDELRPVMSGVLCELSPEAVTFVATDAHKLVKYSRTDHKGSDDATFILPKKPLNQLKNILNFDETPVKIEYNITNAAFEFENVNLICRLIDGNYPNYEAVIPKENPNKLIIDRVQLLNSIKRVSIFANQSTHQVRFKISGKELILSAEDVDYSNEAKERLSCSYEGEDMEIGFNSRFILEMLNNIETEQVMIEMSTPNRAGILLPMNPDNSEENMLMLVMPVMLNA